MYNMLCWSIDGVFLRLCLRATQLHLYMTVVQLLQKMHLFVLQLLYLLLINFENHYLPPG